MTMRLVLVLLSSWSVCTALAADELRGTYVEARTCQVYTGPCFANGEMGHAGKNAVLAWRIDTGQRDGVDLKGLGVAMIVKASHTLGFHGLRDAQELKSLIIVDQAASPVQREALRAFVLEQTGVASEDVVGVKNAAIDLQFDYSNLAAALKVGEFVTLRTRKARPGDCICSNERAFYPPLVNLKGSLPGVTIEGDVSARALGSRWSVPDSRSAFLGVFDARSATVKLASR